MARAAWKPPGEDILSSSKKAASPEAPIAGPQRGPGKRAGAPPGPGNSFPGVFPGPRRGPAIGPSCAHRGLEGPARLWRTCLTQESPAEPLWPGAYSLYNPGSLGAAEGFRTLAEKDTPE